MAAWPMSLHHGSMMLYGMAFPKWSNYSLAHTVLVDLCCFLCSNVFNLVVSQTLKSMKPPHPMIGRLIFENLHEILEEYTFEPHRYLYINVLLRLTHWSWFLLNRPAQSSQNMQCFTHFFMRESYQYHMLLCHCLLFLPLCCPENASNTW